jgi:hypothetical protein
MIAFFSVGGDDRQHGRGEGERRFFGIADGAVGPVDQQGRAEREQQPAEQTTERGQRGRPSMRDAERRRLRDNRGDGVDTDIGDAILSSLRAEVGQRLEELDSFVREIECVGGALLGDRRRPRDAVGELVAVGRVVTQDAAVDDRHELHEAGVDGAELVMELADPTVEPPVRCLELRERIGLPLFSELRRPVARNGLRLETRRRGDHELQDVFGIGELGGEADTRVGSQVRPRERGRDQLLAQREALRSRQHDVRRRGRGGRVLLLRSAPVDLDLRGDPNRSRAPVAHRLGAVLTAEYEDPDRDAGKQADRRDESPPTLYGAEDVLSAQGDSSAFRRRDISSRGTHGY